VTLQGEDIICIAGVGWHDVGSLSLHQYARRLARGNRVLFVDRPDPLVSRRGVERRSPRRLRSDVRPVGETLFWATPPPALPLRFELPVNALNQVVRGTWVKGAAQRLCFRRPILWIHDFDAARLIGRLGEGLVLYQVTDDLPTSHALRANRANRPAAMRARERELVRRADLVITTAPGLCEARRQLNPNTHVVPHGVDAEHFSSALDPELRPVPALHGVPAPIIGFVGQINRRIDVALVAAIAERRPDWSLVLVGPVHEIELDSLRGLANVHLAGAVSMSELPRWMKPMSVAIIPYLVNDHTRSMHPLKALEYLAAGKPVVSTPLPPLSAYGQYVALVAGADRFVEAIDAALRDTDAAAASRRSAFAAGQSWETRLEAISRLVEQTRGAGARSGGPETGASSTLL
jgi:glycosyltransferase involved in cell wall biosynthesis